MDSQHSVRRNRQRERQKSLQHRLRENRLALEFLQKTQQVDIDDNNEGDKQNGKDAKK